MGLISYKRGQGSVILRVKLFDSSVSTGAGKTGILFSATGLIIGTIVDNSDTSTAYTSAGSTTETITTNGTYAAPTATKCGFKEVDATNHKGVYEIQLADARFAIADTKSLLVSISGVTDMAETDVVIPLTDVDPYSVAMARAIRGIALVTVTTAATTTSIPTSSILPAAAVADQFKGRVLTFSDDTTTANLRGQSTIITSNTSGGTLTVTALTTAPVSGDIATIQ